MKNNNLSAATLKEIRKKELMEKAAKRAASRNVALPKENKFSEDDIIIVETEKERALLSAVNTICQKYSSTSKNMSKAFSSMLSFLLKLNINTESLKDVTSETEKALNKIGFTHVKTNYDKLFLDKQDIQKLVILIFDEYQKLHPHFCAIDAEIANLCDEEIAAISKKLWHPVFPYLAVQACTSHLVEKDSQLLLSGNFDDVKTALAETNYSFLTCESMVKIAPEVGKMLQKISQYNKQKHYEVKVEQPENSPLEILNPETSSPSNLAILKDCLHIVLLLQENRDLLLKFESTFGLSIKYLMENPEVLEALKKVVDTL